MSRRPIKTLLLNCLLALIFLLAGWNEVTFAKKIPVTLLPGSSFKRFQHS